MTEQCERAVAIGLEEIGFCEHADFEPEDSGTGYLDWEAYGAAIEEHRRRFAGRLRIRKGLEMCYQPCLADGIFSYFDDKEEDVDYLMGSVHWVDHRRVGRDFFSGRTEEEAYGIYFDRVARLVETGFFDVLGHLDIVKRHGTDFYGPFSFAKYEEQIGRVLALLIECGMALEVNTSGFRQAPGEPYPGPATLRLYRRLGGELVTVGSDSHSTSSLASGVRRALDLLREAGFGSLTVYENRTPVQVPIP